MKIIIELKKNELLTFEFYKGFINEIKNPKNLIIDLIIKNKTYHIVNIDKKFIKFINPRI